MTLKFERNTRGFPVATFTDTYGVPCSFQASSIASEERIWLGAESALCLRFTQHGAQQTEYWREHKTPHPNPARIPCDTGNCDLCDGSRRIPVSARMHLNRKQARVLGKALLEWAKLGDDFWASLDE